MEICQDGSYGNKVVRCGQDKVVGCCEYDNELSGSTKRQGVS